VPASSRPRPVNRPHSQPMIPAPSTVSAAKGMPPIQAAPTATGARTTAERMRSVRASGLPALSGRAITPLAAMKLAEGPLEVRLGEVRPERVDEHELGIGGLPQQEIAQPLLPAGPDDQVGIGHVRREQVALEERLVDPSGIEGARLGGLGDAPSGAR